MIYKIAIVILNYLNYEDTIECIQCSLNQKYTNYDVIVVENGSSNESYEILKNSYINYSQVTIIRSYVNLGFAKGNNLGIQYAREKLKADYVFVCNSDITFNEDLFETIIKADDNRAGAISPSIYDLSGEHQTPTLITNHIYIKILLTIKNIILIWMNYILKLKRRKMSYQKPSISNEIIKYKYMLQGCAYFLTPRFFKYYKQLYPKTFLYWEEINLLVYLDKVDLTAIIVETSPVIHKDKRSTRRLIKQESFQKKKLEYSTTSMMKSLPMFFMKYPTIVKRF